MIYGSEMAARLGAPVQRKGSPRLMAVAAQTDDEPAHTDGVLT
jgi:hypothetical protein